MKDSEFTATTSGPAPQLTVGMMRETLRKMAQPLEYPAYDWEKPPYDGNFWKWAEDLLS